MNEQAEKSRIAVIRLFILTVVCIAAYWPEIKPAILAAPNSSELSHVIIFPLAVFLLVYLRLDTFNRNISSGSVWGVVLLAMGVITYALCIWPFTFGYIRLASIIFSMAGIILISCGWKFLRSCLPLLIIGLLAIPIGPRLYTNLIVYPETLIIDTTAKTLNLLPGTHVRVSGSDLLVKHQNAVGAIALGESNRGARLFFASALIGLFVLLCETRTRWQILAAIVLGIPIIVFCNFFRLLTESLITIYANVKPGDSFPRDLSTVLSLLMSYALFALIIYGNWSLYVTEETIDE